MSQKEVWKDNRTSTAMGIETNDPNWLSSTFTDSKLVCEKANQPHQEKVEDRVK